MQEVNWSFSCSAKCQINAIGRQKRRLHNGPICWPSLLARAPWSNRAQFPHWKRTWTTVSLDTPSADCSSVLHLFFASLSSFVQQPTYLPFGVALNTVTFNSRAFDSWPIIMHYTTCISGRLPLVHVLLLL